MEFAKETLELIQATAVQAAAPKTIEIPGDGRTAFVQHGDLFERIEVPPALRRHQVHCLEDLIAYANQDWIRANPKPVVWHGERGVTVVLDDGDRRDLVEFPLTFSERFNVLTDLRAKRPLLDQRAFIRLLRIELGLDNLAVVGQFRKLDWALGDEGSANVAHGMERMGNQITARMQGVEELPDALDVAVPVYQQAGERDPYIVRCSVEIDVQNRRLQLIPLPDELERIVQLAQASIRERLDNELAEGIPTYYGEP